MNSERVWGTILESVALGCIYLFTTCHPGALGQQNTDGPLIKFDAYHAHTFIDTMPCPGLNEYHLLQGPSRAAKSLEQAGWRTEVQLFAWDHKSLQDVNAVVVNLVSADKPPFLVSEIEALVDFVRSGGGLVFITDHTNCYYHCHVLGPLMHELQIQLPTDLACDRSPRTLSKGNGWIAISKFDDHPITRKLSHIAFQSGGTVDRRFGIAWTSDNSWADAANVPPYGEGVKPGFFGDFKQQPYESKGPLPVVAAKQFGKGRIAVIADQNAVGGMFLNYADNRRLWLQSVAWVSDRYSENDWAQIDKMLDKTEPERSLIWCIEPLSEDKFAFGDDGVEGLFCLYAFLAKCADARATDKTLAHASIAIVPFSNMLRSDTKWYAKLAKFAQCNDHRLIVIGDAPKKEQSADSKSNSLADEETVSAFASDLGFNRDDHPLPFGISGISWHGKNGSSIHLLSDRSQWDNAHGSVPESLPDATTQDKYNRLMEWLITLGISRIDSYPSGTDWLDSLEDSNSVRSDEAIKQ